MRAQSRDDRAEKPIMGLSLNRRRALRRRSTDAEIALWRELRDRRLGGFKFRRQHPCGPFILDFYCAERRLAVELDGGQHYAPDALEYDARRMLFLRARLIDLLRFPNDAVFNERHSVLAAIAVALGVCPSP